MGTVPIKEVLLVHRGGDCEAIEQYVLRSFRIAGAKVVKKIDKAASFVQKILK